MVKKVNLKLSLSEKIPGKSFAENTRTIKVLKLISVCKPALHTSRIRLILPKLIKSDLIVKAVLYQRLKKSSKSRNGYFKKK